MGLLPGEGQTAEHEAAILTEAEKRAVNVLSKEIKNLDDFLQHISLLYKRIHMMHSVDFTSLRKVLSTWTKTFETLDRLKGEKWFKGLEPQVKNLHDMIIGVTQHGHMVYAHQEFHDVGSFTANFKEVLRRIFVRLKQHEAALRGAEELVETG